MSGRERGDGLYSTHLRPRVQIMDTIQRLNVRLSPAVTISALFRPVFWAVGHYRVGFLAPIGFDDCGMTFEKAPGRLYERDDSIGKRDS
jgi:hypothetical protein